MNYIVAKGIIRWHGVKAFDMMIRKESRHHRLTTRPFLFYFSYICRYR